MTRLDKMKAEKQEPVLPYNPAPYLTDWLLEIGPTSGDSPITWQEITAWGQHTGIRLDPWEARTVRRLSRAWLNQRFDARKRTCPEPRIPVADVETRDRVGLQFKAMLSALRAPAPKLGGS